MSYLSCERIEIGEDARIRLPLQVKIDRGACLCDIKGKGGLAGAPHAREPDDRHLPPRLLQPCLPKGTRNHGSMLSKRSDYL